MSSSIPYPLPTQILPHVAIRDLLRHKSSQLHCIAPDETVYRAVELMAEAEVGALVVLQERNLVGIVSEHDYARRIILMGRKSRETLVGAIMTRNVITISLDTSLEGCLQLMSERQIRHLPVVERSRVIGMVTIGDVVRAVLKLQSQTIEELNRYVSGEPRLSTRVA